MGASNKLHLAITTALRGAGGSSGDKPRTPIESPDSLRSIAYARIVDLVSEGEIVGFADQANPLTCVYLNETPVANADGSLNFKNLQIDSRVGTQTQDYLPNFEGVENEIAIGLELRQETPWVRAITNLNLNSVRVRLSVPVLTQTNTSNGDITGASVSYRIELQTDGGAFVTKLTSAFTGKTTTKYERSHRIELPPAATGWTIRVVRITANSETAGLQNATYIESFAEIVEAKLRMPMSALVSVIVDAEQFGSIPSRAYRLKGRIIRVPSNYDPDTREYTGVWDGTFQSRYSNNPAWVFYDMALNTRYGLGHMVPQDLVDKWTLYRIAQYCDQEVPDGFGGLEPRFTCNLVLQAQNDALRVMQDLATVFRGIIYANGGSITAVGDMPEDPVYTYTPANVIDGKFTYSGSSRKVRHTVALVSWTDLSDFGRAKVEYVDDPEGIARYGIQQTEVIAIGCTSRGQARRWGRYLLATERYETDTVAFGVGLDGTVVAPGKIINIADPLRSGQRRGGRIKSATASSVTVDMMAISVSSGDTLVATLPTGVTQRRIISSIVGNTINVGLPFTAVPVTQSVWAVDSDDVPLASYRVLGVAERDEGDSLGYNLTGIVHIPGKFGFADTGEPIEVTPIPDVPGPVVPSPTGLAISQRDVTDQNTTVKVVNLSWDIVPVAVAYNVQWRQGDGSWADLGNVGYFNIDLPNVRPGPFEVQVIAINALGQRSLPAFGGPYDIAPVSTPPGFVEDLITGQEALEAVGLENQAAIAQEIIDRLALEADLAVTNAQLAVVQGQVGDILQADEWVLENEYIDGDLVQSAGVLYRALQNVPANTPITDALYWEPIGNYASLGEAVGAIAAQATATETAVTQLDNELTALTTTVTQQGVEIADKADASAVDLLTTRVTDAENEITSISSDITSLTATVDTKASTAALSALDARVTSAEGSITAQASDITSLTATLGSVANPNHNMLSNPSGAVDAAGWSGPSLVRESSSDGPRFRVTSAAGTAQIIYPHDYIPANQNVLYSAAMDMIQLTGTAGAFFFQMLFQDSGGNVLASHNGPTQTNYDVWERKSVSAVSPAGTTRIVVRVVKNAGSLTNIYWRRVKVERGDVSPFSEESDQHTTANAVTSLDARVTTAEGTITSQASQLTSLNVSLFGVGGNNMIPNHSGHLGTEGWGQAGSPGLSTVSPQDGHQFRFAANGAAATKYVYFDLPAAAGNQFNFSADVYVNTGHTGAFYIDVIYLDDGATVLDGANAVYSLSGNSWERLSVSAGPAPAGTTHVRARVVASSATWSLMAFRRAKLESGSSQTPFSTESSVATNASATQALEARVTSVEGVNTAQASSITSLNADVGTANASITSLYQVVASAGAGNAAANAGFEDGAAHWLLNASASVITHASSRSGNNVLIINGAATPGVATQEDFVPVKTGQIVRIGFYTRRWTVVIGPVGAFIRANISWFDKDKNSIAYVATNCASTTTATTFQKVIGSITVPAGAAFCRVTITTSATSGNWGVDDVTVEPLTDLAANAFASAGLTIDVNGYITGYRMTNDGSTSNFSIVADQFLVISPGGGARTEFSNGNWRVYDSSGVLRTRLGVW